MFRSAVWLCWTVQVLSSDRDCLLSMWEWRLRIFSTIKSAEVLKPSREFFLVLVFVFASSWGSSTVDREREILSAYHPYLQPEGWIAKGAAQRDRLNACCRRAYLSTLPPYCQPAIAWKNIIIRGFFCANDVHTRQEPLTSTFTTEDPTLIPLRLLCITNVIHRSSLIERFRSRWVPSLAPNGLLPKRTGVPSWWRSQTLTRGMVIAHFRVPLSLSFKASPSAKFLLW